MGRRAKPEEIIAKLREVEVRLNQGETIAQAMRAIAATEQTFYRWRKRVWRSACWLGQGDEGDREGECPATAGCF